MATQQGKTTGQCRFRQQRLQSTQHHCAEDHAPPANGRDDEGSRRGIHDRYPVVMITRPIMIGPIMVQPLYYIPPLNAALYRPGLPHYERYVPLLEGRGVLAGPRCIRLKNSTTLRNLTESNVR
ncbi:hypothetical protein MRX96_044283 [Rhipicephalus microplus]